MIFAPVRSSFAALLLVFGLVMSAQAQQVVQRGLLGRPGAVLDETEEWTAPLPLAEDHEVAIYMPDISTAQWLERNYNSYMSRGTYTLTLFTLYRTPRACRENQIAWGLGDVAHLNACLNTAYRLRRARVDTQSRTVTLEFAAMVDENGNIVPSTVQEDHLFRTWDELDANTLGALNKADTLIARQMTIYDAKQRSLH